MLNVKYDACVYVLIFVQLSRNPMTNVGALMLLKTYKKNSSSAIEEIDISVSAAKAFVCISTCDCNICSGNLKCYVCALYVVCCMQSVLVREAFMQQLAKFRPSVKVRYTVLNSVTRNLAAFKIFKVSGQRRVHDQNITAYIFG